jgi:immune inhibitor A
MVQLICPSRGLSRSCPSRWTPTPARSQSYDSPFSLHRTDGVTLHKAGVATIMPSSKGVPAFNDHTSTYYDESNPLGGVKITDTNTKIEIVKEAKDGSTISLEVGPAVKQLAFSQVRR